MHSFELICCIQMYFLQGGVLYQEPETVYDAESEKSLSDHAQVYLLLYVCVCIKYVVVFFIRRPAAASAAVRACSKDTKRRKKRKISRNRLIRSQRKLGIFSCCCFFVAVKKSAKK